MTSEPGDLRVGTFDEMLALLLPHMGDRVDVMIGPPNDAGYTFAVISGTLRRAPEAPIWAAASGDDEEAFTVELGQAERGSYVVLYRNRFDGASVETVASGLRALTITQQGVCITFYLGAT
jgi:hypothetical protein